MKSELLKYLIKTRRSRIQLLFASVAIIGAITAYLVIGKPFPVQWANWIDIFITISTLLIAIFVWLNENIENWERSLPKKLNITYLLEGRKFATVRNAPLASDNDIRNWGQSIGQTILNSQDRIKFTGFKTNGPFLQKSEKVQLYELVIYLIEAIPDIKEGTEFLFDEDGNINQENLKQFIKK